VRALDGVGVRKASTGTRSARSRLSSFETSGSFFDSSGVAPWKSAGSCRFQMTGEGFEICNFHLMGL